MTHIALVRHGETAWNKERRAQGHSNNPLNLEGLSQAKAVADRLAAEEWDVIYSSDLLRAQQTAACIAERLGIENIGYDPRLREMAGGLIEGTTIDERVRRWGTNWHRLELGIETKEQGMDRGGASIEAIAEKHPDGNVIVVSHGAIIRHMLSRLIPSLNVETLLDNASVTRIRSGAEGWQCELYNCTLHLGGRP